MDLNQYFEIHELPSISVRRFRTTAKAFLLRFKNLHECPNLFEIFEQIFEEAINKMLHGCPPDSMVGIEIRQPSLYAPVLVPFTERQYINADKVLTIIENVAQSKNEFCFNEDMEFKVVLVDKRPQIGSGLESDVSEFCKNGGAYIRITSNDNLSLARAVVTGIAKLDSSPKWESIRKGDKARHTLQKQLALDLMHKANININEEKYALDAVQKIQKILVPDYQIKVYYNNILFFQGPEADKAINLHAANNHHYDLITKMPQ